MWTEYMTMTGVALLALLLGIKIYLRVTTGICRSLKRMDGKTVIITGANSGIGKETALDMAKRGAKVIMACRNLERAEKAKEEILSIVNEGDVTVKHLDLASLKSVNSFTKLILQTENHVDVLINNAGVAGFERRLTEDGLEYHMQSNYFGHFLLTNQLLDLMIQTKKARIIVVSSVAHKGARTLDLENLNGERRGDPATLYCMSKLCNILFANELARRLKGTDVTVNSLHPGVVETEIFRCMPVFVRIPFLSIVRLFCKDAREGAQTTIYLAVSEKVEGITGKYFVDCKKVQPSIIAKDVALAQALWEKTEKMVSIKDTYKNL
ncbi:retinol dehydrogenase 14-like isoform X1 [Artemia franciscana]|uniref:retinol dehydrogenase 14-like isoform X1 n=1 Tax=Artemia franciscana TaxID=6661 RepID=UPI0032DA0A36